MQMLVEFNRSPGYGGNQEFEMDVIRAWTRTSIGTGVATASLRSYRSSTITGILASLVPRLATFSHYSIGPLRQCGAAA